MVQFYLLSSCTRILIPFIDTKNRSYLTSSAPLSVHHLSSHSFHFSASHDFSHFDVWRDAPTPFPQTTLTYCHYCTEQSEISFPCNIPFLLRHTCKISKSSRNAAHFPCSAPQHPRQSSFHITRGICHHSIRRLLFRYHLVQRKSWKRQRLSSHCLKAYQESPKRAVTMSLPKPFCLPLAIASPALQLESFRCPFQFSSEYCHFLGAASSSNTLSLTKLKKTCFYLLRYLESSLTP